MSNRKRKMKNVKAFKSNRGGRAPQSGSIVKAAITVEPVTHKVCTSFYLGCDVLKRLGIKINDYVGVDFDNLGVHIYATIPSDSDGYRVVGTSKSENARGKIGFTNFQGLPNCNKRKSVPTQIVEHYFDDDGVYAAWPK